MRAYLPLTLADTLELNASRFGDQLAYVVGERKLTHAHLLLRAKKIASALERLGVRKQDRVSMLSMNSIEYGEVLAAGQLSGIIIATINFRLAAPEIFYIANDTAPRVLIFEASYLPVIEQLRAQLKTVEHYICIDGETEWATSYEKLVGTGDESGPAIRAAEDDIACLIYTSGTTGRPKGCIWGQREYRQLAQILACEQRTGSADRALLVMPMFHIGAMAIQLAIHFRGGAVHLHRQFDPAALLTTTVRGKITLLHLAPTMVQMVLEQPGIDDMDLSHLKTLIYSAAAMPGPVLQRGLKLLGNVFLQMYGQSEVITAGLQPEQHLPNGSAQQKRWLTSVGHAFPSTLLKIIDDNGNDCAISEAGEIAVKTVAMARGYWNNHPGTLDTFRDGWCHTGDMGKLDENGFLYLVDRKKDMIISGGENIYSREVEEAVLSHAAVSECAVIGLADEKWGEAVCAIVVLRKNQSIRENELIEHTKTQIASYKKPKIIIFADELPKLATGKINKIELRERFATKKIN
ncbi:MAG: acyl-CoA synthetase (AMP-forming)/AMP-acid ligase [Verrucomicrobiaceae bacterium]|nr:acyl-CoA synthetase (AMP-forming)/AMP-acid ligase [Verrucomicrobiaceae bacterium]